LVILHRESNPDVKAFMVNNDISSKGQLESYFFQNVVSLLDSLSSKYIAGEEMFLNGVTLPDNTAVHVRNPGAFDTLAAVDFFFPHERQRITFDF
jgi:hypothetical protein